MKISSFRFLHATIPFKFSFSHSLISRTETDSLICIVQTEYGKMGYGEGAPRPYVTGETLERSGAAAKNLAQEMLGLKITSCTSLLDILSELGSIQLSRENPAAWCAIELAILDLFSKQADWPLWRLFTDSPKCQTSKYSGVLPLVSHDKLYQLCDFIKKLELDSVKIKLNDPQEGLERLKLVRSVLGQEVELRVDFNGATSATACLRFLDEARPYNIAAIEQPVPRLDLEGLREVAGSSDVPIIADESMYTDRGAEYLIDKNICHGLNVRLSSCGGVIRSLALLHKCRERNVLCQLGAQVGETGILTSAQQNVVAIFGAPDFIEGGAVSYLLCEDVCTEDISFGKKGLAPVPRAPGLGVRIDETILARWCEPIFTLT